MFKQFYLFFFLFLIGYDAKGQSNIVTYAGSSGRDGFYDVTALTDGTFLVCGYAADLDWVQPSVPKTPLSFTGSIPNAQGSNRYGFILQLSGNLQTILQVVYFPKGAVEDIRFIKTNSLPYKPTGDLFISCNTADVDANNGGYIIAKLNHNFLNGIPNQLVWHQVVWAKAYAKTYHPWDVTSKGEVYYVSGESHGYDWSAMYCLNPNGQRKVVTNWRTHWLKNGTEWKGTPASSNPFGTVDSVNYSGIAFKISGRCELRSWTLADFNTVTSDGNGGTRKGKWPADFLFDSPCNPSSPSATSPGYNGYSPESCCPVWGGSCLAIDRRDDHVYLGMNFKSYYNPSNTPDFEPAVIGFDSTGMLTWWSRLYHEITPLNDTVGSIPDQYVDALSIDYTNNELIVAARAHGNNTENLWEGNTINANPGAMAFQNQFTGSNGNIHESWLGRLNLQSGTLTHSTYVAELAEGTGGLGTPHNDPNLDGWPDPNTGWPDVNTTYITKNNMKVSSNGDVCILGVGRRTITTKNAYQKMVKPTWGGKSCWNSFVRMYDKNLKYPKYSSLVVGVWDTLNQSGGDNTELFGLYKTANGILAVGRQKADTSNNPVGNTLPVTQVPSWGAATPSGESALLVFYTTDSLMNTNDQISLATSSLRSIPPEVYPNPATQKLRVYFKSYSKASFNILNVMGEPILQGALKEEIDISAIPPGFYLLVIETEQERFYHKFLKW